MIVGIHGHIVKKEPTFLHIDTGGLIYGVHISVNCYNEIKDLEPRLLTTQIFKEDGVSLYGFMDANEQRMFENLLKISGVGPKAAMAICSSFTPATFEKILITKDATTLKKAPGIGPKTALRIVTELGDYKPSESINIETDHNMGAIMALESLGFKREEIAKALVGVDATDTGVLVKEALKKLQRL